MGRKRKDGKRDDDKKLDATDERLSRAIDESGAVGGAWEWVDPSRIDSRKSIERIRRFKASHLDRWYRKDDPEKSQLTFRQFYAGDWYRNTHARSGFNFSVIASYGERISGTEPAYGMPRTERQADARKLWREAKAQFPPHMSGFMDGLLLHDFIPGYASTRAGRKGKEAIMREICKALDLLADWLLLAAEQQAA
jgi:hypothetical protein